MSRPKVKKGDIQFSPGKNDAALVYYGDKINTVEELLAHAKIDLTIWRVESAVINNWEVAGKIDRGSGKDGKKRPEQLWQTGNRQIKVKLVRLAPKPIQDSIKDLLASYKLPKALAPLRGERTGGKHMLEIALHDAHFGKLCWGEETGQNYDLKIAEKVYCEAIDKLLDGVAHYNVEKIELPIGSDFFHVDNWLGTTAKGTPVESTDDRFSKTFKVGVRAASYVIRRCREIAPVEVRWIPGNHDPATSWYLTQVLGAMYSGDKHVKLDDSPKYRKYMSYGPALIGLAHGDEVRHDRLPLIMATDVPDLWAKARHRHWHTGHLHKKGKTVYMGGDTFNGVEVWVLPSLSGTDMWHYKNGFVNNVRAAEAYIWSKEEGYVGHVSSSLDEAKQAA